ncbi:unnamed protein product [Prorocentrum cordatum]|uniref:Uncharacterized protein n=1 Tax=Prorocentrum cordatum TaxID=2364126 RepID=A0ABN9VKH2_9DINO|nr:unnamed protein product [Polarella glacialis]
MVRLALHSVHRFTDHHLHLPTSSFLVLLVLLFLPPLPPPHSFLFLLPSLPPLLPSLLQRSGHSQCPGRGALSLDLPGRLWRLIDGADVMQARHDDGEKTMITITIALLVTMLMAQVLRMLRDMTSTTQMSMTPPKMH